LQDHLSSLEEIALLEGSAGADVGLELVEENGVILAILDVGGEVRDTKKISIANVNRCMQVTHVRFHLAFFRW
jgi:hypothetical protein